MFPSTLAPPILTGLESGSEGEDDAVDEDDAEGEGEGEEGG